MALNQQEKARLDKIESDLAALTQLLTDASAEDKAEAGAGVRIAALVDSVKSFSEETGGKLNEMATRVDETAKRVDELPGAAAGVDGDDDQDEETHQIVSTLLLVVAHLQKSAFAAPDTPTQEAMARLRRNVSDNIVAAAVEVKEAEAALVDSFELARAVKELETTVSQLRDVDDPPPQVVSALAQARASLKLYREKLAAAEDMADVG